MRPLLLLLLPLLAAPAWALSPWEVIEGVELRETGGDDDWAVEKTYPDGWAEGAESFVIEGYAVVYAAQAVLTDVLLVPDASQCPFCGGDQGYGPTLEVVFDRPVTIEVPEEPILVQGRLEAVDDPRTYQAFRLVDARRLRPDL